MRNRKLEVIVEKIISVRCRLSEVKISQRRWEKWDCGVTEDQDRRAVYRRAGRSAAADLGDRSERMSSPMNFRISRAPFSER
jgi:hypothetical protein